MCWGPLGIKIVDCIWAGHGNLFPSMLTTSFRIGHERSTTEAFALIIRPYKYRYNFSCRVEERRYNGFS